MGDVSSHMHIFRSYDIRGIYKKDIDEGIAERIGNAFGRFIGEGKRICVGRDYRNGSDSLKDAFTEGAASAGVSVVDIGIVPTPILYSVIIRGGFDGGIMITASHNPAEWNGIKMCKKNAEMVAETTGMEDIKRLFKEKQVISKKKGSITKQDDVVNIYMDHVLQKVHLGRKLSLVIDSGNGAWSGIAKRIFERLGCKAYEINGEPDSSFSARGPDPNESSLEGLKKKVLEEKADFGVGFDGDGDRAGFVDDKGRFVGTGSILIPILAKYYLKGHKGGKVVYDVPCSMAVEEVIQSAGGIPLIDKTGHTNIASRMMSESALLGGEYSNHIYFSENYGLDDGGYAAVKMAELISNSKEKLSELVDSIPHYENIAIEEIPCTDDKKFKVIEQVKSRFASLGFDKIIDIDGIKAFKGKSWVLVRASNTMPVIKINGEGRSRKEAEELFKLARVILLEEIGRQKKLD